MGAYDGKDSKMEFIAFANFWVFPIKAPQLSGQIIYSSSNHGKNTIKGAKFSWKEGIKQIKTQKWDLSHHSFSLKYSPQSRIDHGNFVLISKFFLHSL